tara:strand:- start:4366 stop:4848 length:483 start_codon:yes stop_codon:yes gene_type:complete
MDGILFQGWDGLGRTALVSVLAYVGLVVFLRLSGKRTLSKLNAFDLVVTVALGSILATTLLNKDVPLAEGLVAFASLILLQYGVTWSSVRWGWVRRGVRSEPTILVRHGQPVTTALRRERVTEAEALSAVRDSGGRHLEEAEVVVLESDGSLTAILKRGD